MSTPYANTTLLKKAINKAIFDNTQELVKASAIAAKINEVVDYFEANTSIIPTGASGQTLKYDINGNLVANANITQDDNGIVTIKSPNNAFGYKQYINLYALTTNNTGVDLKLSSTISGIPIPINCVIKLRVEIVGIQIAGSAGTIGDGITRAITGAVRNISGTPIADMGSGLSVGEVQESSALSGCVMTTNNLPGILNINIQGQTNKTIQWSAVAELTVTKV